MINSQFAIQRLEAADPSGLTLRVEFVRLADRYGQVFSLVDRDGTDCPLLESIEGAPTDDWPTSPPLQNLSIEELTPGRCVALLVGMAARNHWSASIEPVAGQAAIDCDIACRAASSAGPLGSAYMLAKNQPHAISVPGDAGAPADLEVAVADNIRLRVQALANYQCRAMLAEGRVLITPQVSSGPKSGTWRWKYRVALARA